VVILDAESARRLYGRQHDVRRPMASLTKLMTALIIVENHALTEAVRIPSGAENMQGNRAFLVVGEQFTIGDLLSAMLIASANDAAYTLAAFHSGSQEEFVRAMNDRASALGLKATSFANPTGLDDPTQWSTPQDIAWLTLAALRHPAIQKRLSTRGMTIRSVQGTSIALTHTHALLHASRPLIADASRASSTVLAGKTGTTDSAGQCLMTVVGEGNRRYVVVLMDSLQRYQDMRSILDALDGAAPVVPILSLHTEPSG
jgi:serine-type D-Ala-D-Ala carboxypeptidase (penicillin-binding protein 5/6)